MPRSVYQRVRSSIQYWCHCSSVPGSTKNSISICSNSSVRKMKLPGVISLRKDLPIWATPNGGFLRAKPSVVLKSRKMPWAVSGRRDTVEPAVVGVRDPAVDFGGRKDEPASLAESDDLVHGHRSGHGGGGYSMGRARKGLRGCVVGVRHW